MLLYRICYKFFRIVPNVRLYFYRFYNQLFFKLIGIEFGNNMKISNKIYVRGSGNISIGDSFLVSSGDDVNPISRNIRTCFYTGTKQARIVIGDNVGMSSVCLWANTNIIIGNNVNIGANTLILDNDAHPHKYELRRRGVAHIDDVPSAPVVIDDDVWVGAECIILKGVHIGARSIIAAGSVVINSIPEDCVAGGNPCKVIHPLK